MTVFVTGAQGMLGRALMQQLADSRINAHGFSHGELDIRHADQCVTVLRRWAKLGDTLINCAGALPGAPELEMIEANALGPHALSWACRMVGISFIHISTDCVFEDHQFSRAGPRRFRATEDLRPKTFYGFTKATGEFDLQADIIIRTSFVGPDHGVWHWLQTLGENEEITGWTSAFWSGSTVWEVARVIVSIVSTSGRDRPNGILHLATWEPITKYEVCRLVATAIGRKDIKIVLGGPYIDRSLDSMIPLKPLKEALLDAPDGTYRRHPGRP